MVQARARKRVRRVVQSGRVAVTTKEHRRIEEYRDLSLGGLFIQTLIPERPGSSLRVDLKLMGLTLSAPARVLWTQRQSSRNPSGMGVAFESLNPQQKKLIYKQISAWLEQGHSLDPGTPPPRGDGGGLGQRTKTARRSLLSRIRGR